MAAAVVVFLSLWSLTLASEVVEVRFPLGTEAVLGCLYPRGAAAPTRVLWSRADLREPVLFYRENRTYPRYQDGAFRDRVELRDPAGRDFSLRVAAVTEADAGVFTCRVRASGARSRREEEFSRSVSLTVSPAGTSEAQEGPTAPENSTFGLPGLGVGLFFCILAVAVVIFVVFKRFSRSKFVHGEVKDTTGGADVI